MLSNPRNILKLLIIIFAMQGLGYCLTYWQTHSYLETIFFMEFGFPPHLSRIADYMFIAFHCALFIPYFARQPFFWYTASFLYFIQAASASYLGGSYASELAIGAHAVRIILPLAIGILMIKTKDEVAFSCRFIMRWENAENLIRYSIASTFLFHGLEALMYHPQFIDLIIGSFRGLGITGISEARAKDALLAIGAVDVLVAFLLFFNVKTKQILYWMLFWGLLTASSRLTYYGLSGYPKFLMRAANFGLPLILLYAAHCPAKLSTLSRLLRDILSRISFPKLG